ncbi:NlpC/P60 family protein [Fictibacillus phosphorivorans]|uniref:C40 family peptidase n=1 Tax=Fictibacillus phosphorivorans TaxID=1221500 RepID=UPI00203BD226|nr:NlpC/P60 family protein [Fictibacillus phosphorivorans]MCM3719249.1 NlpC/P60 family protein [Fictibacillus phosphorivorans]MCM3776871.1 NlpC/P60 family protein [Fictibacillus phosphorivorans]
MLKLLKVLFSLAMLLTIFTNTASAEKGTTVKNVVGKDLYVDVAAATLWSEPEIARKDVDGPSLSNPVDLRGWTTGMTYEEKLWLVGNLETQALYGQKVRVLEQQDEWVKVAVYGQPTPRNELGYPGWMPLRQLTTSKQFSHFEGKPFALITSPTAWLSKTPFGHKKDLELSYNTRLPVLKAFGHNIAVLTPKGKVRWLDAKDAKVYKSENDIPVPTGERLVDEAKKFLGLPYLWAGAAGFGFDCSGFTHTLHKANGITIPRDSGPQSTEGLIVDKDQLQPGDLMFFAYDEGKGRVHHVAMYAGNGMMIHSPNTASTVRMDPISTPAYAIEFSGARRYVPGQ